MFGGYRVRRFSWSVVTESSCLHIWWIPCLKNCFYWMPCETTLRWLPCATLTVHCLHVWWLPCLKCWNDHWASADGLSEMILGGRRKPYTHPSLAWLVNLGQTQKWLSEFYLDQFGWIDVHVDSGSALNFYELKLIVPIHDWIDVMIWSRTVPSIRLCSLPQSRANLVGRIGPESPG